MGYRRRQGLSRSSTFKEGSRYPPDHDDTTTSSSALPHTASDSGLDSYGSRGAFHSSFKNGSKGSATSEHASVRSSNERGGFWAVLARKAKAILEEEVPQQSNACSSVKRDTISFSKSNQVKNRDESFEDLKKMDSPALRIGLDRLKPSLTQISYTIGNSLEDRRVMKNEEKNQDPRIQSAQPQRNQATLIQEMKNDEKDHDPGMQSAQPKRNQETLIQASRDVAITTAAKVKQLMRELKTVKAELALAEELCRQLEEENKLLLGDHEKGDHPAYDDMIRVQLETLLEEKGRLAHDNSVHALENRYLREIVEFHQLTMQDLIYLESDEGIIEVVLPSTPEAY